MGDLLTEDRQQTFPKAFGQPGEHRKSKIDVYKRQGWSFPDVHHTSQGLRQHGNGHLRRYYVLRTGTVQMCIRDRDSVMISSIFLTKYR